MSVSSVRNNLLLLRQEVHKFISSEMEQQKGADLNAHLEAARDVSVAIENAFVAYDYPGVLALTTDKVTATVTHQLDELRMIVSQLTAKNAREVVGLYSRVHQLMFELKLQNWQSCLSGAFPRHVYVTRNRFQISFTGNFKDAIAYKAAELVIGEDRFKFDTQKSTESKLYFVVQLREGCLPDSALKNCYVLKGRLEVDYNLGHWMSWARKATYEVYMGIFPLAPGEGTLTYPKREVVRQDQRVYKSANFTIRPEGAEASLLVEKHIVVLPSPGWKITGVPRVVTKDYTTDVAQDQYTADQVNVKLSLPAGQPKLKAHVEFQESQDVIEDRDHTQPLTLKWDEPFDFESPTFTIRYKTLEGTDLVLTETDKKKPGLEVTAFEGKHRLIATPSVE